MRVVLTQIEVTGIQTYIFGSNNLKQNIGASELVTRSMTHWLIESLNDCGLTHNGTWDDRDIRLNDRRITDDGTDAEIIYAGGGNALIVFQTTDDPYAKAKACIQSLTARVLCEAHGLSLVVAHSPVFNWHDEALSAIHLNLRQRVAQRKRTPVVSLPSLGLSVTAVCSFTGFPAVDTDGDGRRISAIAQDKLHAESSAKARLNSHLRRVTQEGYEFAHDFALFGEQDESRYIAVVHIDGNRMGERFEAIAQAHPRSDDNDAYALQLRTLSEQIKVVSLQALESTVDLLLDSINEEGKFGGKVPVPVRSTIRYLPFRPIVFGGDDITFVCEGRLGLSLAVHFLQNLLKLPLPGPRASQTGESLYARAGVAIVKSHYPFARAYHLAEELSVSVKKRLKDWAINASMLDWHISTSGAVFSLEDIRRREFTSDDGHSLLMRPLLVQRGERVPYETRFWRSWDTFQNVFFDFEAEWSDKRNKVKALRDALRQGRLAVETFRANYQQNELPMIRDLSREVRLKGWVDTQCGYFDVIEALDFHVPLQVKTP